MTICSEGWRGGQRIIFLGGIFPPDQIDFIHRHSRGVIQSAADALQKGFIRGFAAHKSEMVIVNLPYVGSYPQLFKRPIFPAVYSCIDGVPLVGQRLLLVKYVKTIHRLIGAFRGLRKVNPKKSSSSPDRTIVMIYAAHLPFLLASLAHRMLGRKCDICLILPDFPEFMSDGGSLYKAAKYIETVIFNQLVKHVDYFVVLTKAMGERLEVPENRYVVVEGIADDVTENVTPNPAEGDKRVFLYTGTLAARYGVVDLVSAFKLVRAPNTELWICGEGDSRAEIEQAALTDHRIKFFGQVPRDEARKLQAAATILVNPRSPTGEFTKYSFPSKTMEYMASGRPVLMHRLPGIPEEYFSYFVSPKETTVEAFGTAMEDMASWSNQMLAEAGERAFKFVVNEKNARVQTAKIIEMLDANSIDRRSKFYNIE